MAAQAETEFAAAWLRCKGLDWAADMLTPKFGGAVMSGYRLRAALAAGVAVLTLVHGGRAGARAMDRL